MWTTFYVAQRQLLALRARLHRSALNQQVSCSEAANSDGMPAFPSHVVASPVPELDDVTLVETGCRLVGSHDHDRTGCARGLTVPSIRLDLSAIDQALEQHVPVVTVPEHPSAGPGGKGTAADARSSSYTAVQALKASARFLLARLGLSSLLLPSPAAHPFNLIAWHCNKQTLAVGHASSGAVLLYDCADAGAADVLDKAQQVLTHQLQQQVSSLAWRPVNSSMMAVGCKGGVALWSLGKLPLAASNRSGAGGAAHASGWVSFLPYKNGCRVTSLAWSPDGRLLAGSSSDSNRMVVWDVALGVGATLRLGLQPVSCLAWSPDGSYLFAAARSGRFFLYETTTWSLRSWDTPPGAAVTAAAWAPDSSVVLLAMSGSNYLIALHLVGEPPQLVEQLLPITLPGVSDIQLENQPAGAAATCLQSMAWDASGSRLAVVLGKPHPAAGTVALYSTSYSPVVDCKLIGYMQPRGVRTSAAAQPSPAAEHQDNSNAHENEGAGAQSSGDLSLAFAPVAGKAGAVLSIRVDSTGASGSLQLLRNVPMYF